MEFKDMLKKLRESQGLSQVALSEKLGMSKCSYEKNIKSYLHELLHIDRGDLQDGVDADYAECVCHA